MSGPRKFPLRFTVKFQLSSSHYCEVLVYKTRGSMRGVLRKRKHNSTHTEAACWQANNPTKDNCVAKIFLAAKGLQLDSIIHECVHAAYHRTLLTGVPLDRNEIKNGSDDFEEWVALVTGNLADALIAYLDKEEIAINYDCVKRRMI